MLMEILFYFMNKFTHLGSERKERQGAASPIAVISNVGSDIFVD